MGRVKVGEMRFNMAGNKADELPVMIKRSLKMASSFSSGEGLEGSWDNLSLKRAAKTSLKARA